MQLHGTTPSPYTRHCRIALIEEEIAHEFVETGATDAANISPTRKIPFLQDGERLFTDSSSILKHVRERSGKRAFFESPEEFDLYCLVNTLMDSTISYMLMARMDPDLVEGSTYVARQRERVKHGLESLNQRSFSQCLPLNDAEVRLACFLSWGVFRSAIDLNGLTQLSELLQLAETWGPFIETAPA